jgi:hypothetical protein
MHIFAENYDYLERKKGKEGKKERRSGRKKEGLVKKA